MPDKNIQMPDGTVVAFPGNMSDDDISAAIKKNQPQPPSTMDKIGSVASDIGSGIAQGAANTTAGLGRMLGKTEEALMPGSSKAVEPFLANLEARRQNATRSANNIQSGAKTAEQIGEFLIPGMDEERVASMLPKAGGVLGKILPAAVRIGVPAIETGLRNETQGGDFGTGAAMGAGGSILGQGMKAVAPKMAESALGVTGRMRGNGKTIGKAILDETSGYRPATIAKQAGKRIGQLTGELESKAADASRAPYPLGEIESLRGKLGYPVENTAASTQPALDLIDNELKKAGEKNSAVTADKLNAVRKQLTENFQTGEGIGPDVTPQKVMNLKRGINDLITSWTPEQKKGIQPVLQRVYGALDKELDRTVPGAEQLNQRISSLIPGSQRAAKEANKAGMTQRMLGRVGAHTGALAGAALGYHEYGPKGAILGLALPEVLASPTGGMFAAHSLNSPILPRMLAGAATQFNRSK